MRVRRIDNDDDWTFGAGRANYAQTSESVAQRVKTRLQSFVTDWFLNLDHGLPWFARMERPLNLNAIERAIRQQILTTKGVTEILEYEQLFDSVTRTLTVTASVRDIYGSEQSISTNLNNK